jgi:Zn-dependent protease
MFRSGWTIADFRGIPIRVHPSLLFILPIMAIAITGQELPARFVHFGVPVGEIIVPTVLYGVGLSLSLFGAVLLHEIGHAAVALHYNMPVRAITLMILGGMTEIDQDDASPKETFLVALAGPAVNLVLGLICIVTARLLPMTWTDVLIFLALFGALNVLIAVFNLIPSMPLDGGRMLKSALTWRLDVTRAARIAGTIGRALALGGGLYGLMLGEFMIVLLCVFLYFGAGADQANTSVQEALQGLTARQAMTIQVVSVPPHASMPSVARHMLMRDADVALVRDAHGTYGVILAQTLNRARAESAADLVDGEPLSAWEDDALPELVSLMRWHEKPVIVKDRYNTPIGVITHEDVVRAARLRILADRGLEEYIQSTESQHYEA